MGKIVCFGEVMMRLAPPGVERFGQCTSLGMTFGGAEANVAVSLANFDHEVSFVTRLPQNPFADAAIAQLRGAGVDTTDIARGGERIGIYFLEKGASMRPSKVVYDRKYSAIAAANPGDFDWNTILEGAEWLHTTGITPALSQGTAALTLQAAATARELGLTVSCDLNYRKNLWTHEQAATTMGELCRNVDVLIANEEDAHDVFGITAKGADIDGGHLDAAGYADIARQLAERFGCKYVAFTLRESRSANDNGWSGLLYNAATDSYVQSRKYDIHIVDRVGGGDSFGAGLIHALSGGKDDEAAINFAVAASALKHTIEGDFNRVSVAEVNALAGGSVSGRVQR